MSSMLVRHPRDDETAGLDGRRVSRRDAFSILLGRDDIVSSLKNEDSIEAGRRVGVVVSLR